MARKTSRFNFDTPIEVDPLMTTSEVAEYTNTSVSHLGQMRHRGQGPKWIKFSTKKVLYRKSEIDSWLEANVRTITE